jgi:DNA invertase Pin-like site-specific DNA recombinase
VQAVGYLRVSTAAQAEDGLGLEVQEERIQSWAAAGGHRLLAIHRDEGISGDAEEIDRPGLSAAIVATQDAAEALVVYRLDRLARRLFRQEMVIHQLRQRGRSVVSVSEADIDSEDPTRVLMRQMLGAFAEYERAVIKMRLQGGRRAKADRGGYAFGSPAFGWRADGKELVVDEAEQAVVARILELRDVGAGVRDIARRLNAEGLASKRGTLWHPQTVARVLRRLEGPEPEEPAA